MYTITKTINKTKLMIPQEAKKVPQGKNRSISHSGYPVRLLHHCGFHFPSYPSPPPRFRNGPRNMHPFFIKLTVEQVYSHFPFEGGTWKDDEVLAEKESICVLSFKSHPSHYTLRHSHQSEENRIFFLAKAVVTGSVLHATTAPQISHEWTLIIILSTLSTRPAI